MAKNPAFLQKEIDTLNSNKAKVALMTSFQQTVSMMRRTTEQIIDVSCGNTAAPVVLTSSFKTWHSENSRKGSQHR